MSVEMPVYDRCFVPYGTKDMRICLNPTHISFLTEPENQI